MSTNAWNVQDAINNVITVLKDEKDPVLVNLRDALHHPFGTVTEKVELCSEVKKWADREVEDFKRKSEAARIGGKTAMMNAYARARRKMTEVAAALAFPQTILDTCIDVTDTRHQTYLDLIRDLARRGFTVHQINGRTKTTIYTLTVTWDEENYEPIAAKWDSPSWATADGLDGSPIGWTRLIARGEYVR